jgi:hypothetical protein
MQKSNIDGLELLHRHVTGDWDDLDESDKSGERAVRKEGLSDFVSLWVR